MIAVAQFAEAAQARGLILSCGTVVADGQIHRCGVEGARNGTLDGAYVLRLDGRPIGGFQNHRDGLGWSRWSADGQRYASPTDRARAAAIIAAARQEQADRRAGAADRAASIWTEATPASKDHPYLQRKGISQNGARQRGDALVLALTDGDAITSVQFIDSSGKKRFLPGGKKAGCFFMIGEAGDRIAVAEGFATASSIHESTGLPVAVAFDAGNLLAVATAIRATNPKATLIICADDDHLTAGNPGTTKASDAAKAVSGRLAVPDFVGLDRDDNDTDFNDVARLAGLEAVAKMIALARPVEVQPSAWPELVPLDTPNLPRLTARCLPGFAGDFAEALATATETPDEMAVAMILAVCAAAAARRLRVQVTPTYIEPLNLWLAAALPPGNRKSAVQGAAAAPLLDREREWANELRDEIAAATSERKTMEARASALRAKAAKAEDMIDARDLGRQAADIEAGFPEIPRVPQLWTSDVTPERLGQMLADNEEKAAWLSSEGGLFDTLGGRYSAGIPNLDLVLKAHSGDPERVDRASRPSVFLQSPLLTIGLSPQPDVLRGLAGKPGFRGRGLLGRFLFLLPPSPLGFRTLLTTSIPDFVRVSYASGIRALLDIEPAIGQDGVPTFHTLRLSDDAHAEWFRFAQKIERAMRPGGTFEGLPDWAGKCPGGVLRLAGVLHSIKDPRTPWQAEITATTMREAIVIMEVIAEHSLAAFGLMGANESIGAAHRLWDWITRNRLDRFAEREAFNALRASFPRMADLDVAVDVLIERGYVVKDEVASVGRGRPPSPVITVRPELVAA